MRGIIYILGLLGLSGITFLLLGFCLPNEFKGELSKEFTCDKALLWQKIADPSTYERVKPEIRTVQATAQNAWVTTDKVGAQLRYEVVEKVKNERLVIKVTSPNTGVEKLRTYRVFGDEHSSILTVTQVCSVDRLLMKTTMALSGSHQDLKKEIQQLSTLLNS